MELNGSTNNLEEGEAKRETFGKNKGKKAIYLKMRGKLCIYATQSQTLAMKIRKDAAKERRTKKETK